MKKYIYLFAVIMVICSASLFLCSCGDDDDIIPASGYTAAFEIQNDEDVLADDIIESINNLRRNFNNTSDERAVSDFRKYCIAIDDRLQDYIQQLKTLGATKVIITITLYHGSQKLDSHTWTTENN